MSKVKKTPAYVVRWALKSNFPEPFEPEPPANETERKQLGDHQGYILEHDNTPFTNLRDAQEEADLQNICLDDCFYYVDQIDSLDSIRDENTHESTRMSSDVMPNSISNMIAEYNEPPFSRKKF